MWNWFNCHLSGRHEFGVWCEPGVIFLRCAHCGKRSSGWSVNAKLRVTAPRLEPSAAAAPGIGSPRVLPFDRVASR